MNMEKLDRGVSLVPTPPPPHPQWPLNLTSFNRKKLGIRPEPISGLLCYNSYSLNLQRCETGDSIGLFARDVGLLIQKKSPDVVRF